MLPCMYCDICSRVPRALLRSKLKLPYIHVQALSCDCSGTAHSFLPPPSVYILKKNKVLGAQMDLSGCTNGLSWVRQLKLIFLRSYQ